ncbi:Centrosomal protein of 135 kDa [Geodia barretti]|uniref:Centrosomal protein of 135 kDa n=1 Tax=Geodia barretti TaxID=519541 RepID=A0AA35XGF6_GEOBA|nr:Centrosomal protein of 135 kDa [Geodia barretti]
MATATERKFTNLRKRLDQLGYRQSLGVESLPLVEKLFGDLLQTTESLKSAKQQLGRQQEQKTVWEQQVEPYRADNARVVQENTKLHQQLLRLKESAESRMRDLKTVLRRLEHENADLKFLNTQYVTKMRSLERESETKSERLLALHQKSCEAVIRTPGGKKRQVPLRRQRMEVDSLLHPSSATHMDGGSEKPARRHSPDPYVADLLQVADKRIAQLQVSLETADREKEELQQVLQGLRQQVENRESEIERLAGMLKGGRPPEALAVEGARASNERMVAHLNIQVDFLQQANQELESKLKDAESANGDLQGRVQELSGKNAKICEELSEIGELVKQLEAEREGGEEKYKEKIAELEARAEGLEEEKQELASKLEEMRRVREEVTTDNRRLAEIVVVMEGEGEEAAAMLESLRRERKELRRECVQLRERESSLQRRVSDLERSGGQNFPGGSVSQGEVRRICRERDQLKEATSQMEAELIQIQSDAKSLANDRDNFKLLYEQVQEEVRRLRLEPHGAQGSTTLVQRLERERDDAQRELRKGCREVKTLRERLNMPRAARLLLTHTLQIVPLKKTDWLTCSTNLKRCAERETSCRRRCRLRATPSSPSSRRRSLPARPSPLPGPTPPG